MKRHWESSTACSSDLKPFKESSCIPHNNAKLRSSIAAVLEVVQVHIILAQRRNAVRMRLQNTSRQTKTSRFLFLLPPLARIASLVLDVQQLLRHRADPRACLARQDAGKLRSAIQAVKPRGRWPESNPRGRGASAKPFAPLRAPGARRPKRSLSMHRFLGGYFGKL